MIFTLLANETEHANDSEETKWSPLFSDFPID